MASVDAEAAASIMVEQVTEDMRPLVSTVGSRSKGSFRVGGKSVLMVAALLGAVLACLLLPQRASPIAASEQDVMNAEEEHEKEDDDPKHLSKKAKMSDGKNPMSREEAEKLDQEAAKMYPYTLPNVPVMYPGGVAEHDKDIAVKLEGLDRDAQIRLPGGKEVPYWQTLQYANRHFVIYVTRFREGKVGKKVFDDFPENERVVVWAWSGLLRKLLCTPDFAEWVKGQEFAEGATPELVYESFHDVSKGVSISQFDVAAPRVNAVANGRSIVFDNEKSLLEKDFGYMLQTYAHEQSHNVGYSHASKVPYPIMKFVKEALVNKVEQYEVYDLAKFPEFEVVE